VIPIRNLYYLLSYAWDYPLPEAGWQDIAPDDPRDALNLLASALVRGVDDLVRRGLERGYTPMIVATSQPRGRLLIKESLPLLARRRLQLVVEHDELTHDTLRNRLLRTTLDSLLRCDAIDSKQHMHLHDARKWFAGISPAVIAPGTFAQARPARHNRHYRFLLHLCELIHRLQLPSAVAGRIRFRDLVQDEVVMRGVFEAFVQRFARAHAPAGVTTGREHFRWFNTGDDIEAAQHLPMLKTDINVHHPDGRVLILDCKYYAHAMKPGQWSDTLLHHRENLFQIFAYMQNYAAHHPGKSVSGALLYPMIGTSMRHRYVLCGHETTINTINLNQPWPMIEHDLRELLFGAVSMNPQTTLSPNGRYPHET